MLPFRGDEARVTRRRKRERKEDIKKERGKLARLGVGRGGGRGRECRGAVEYSLLHLVGDCRLGLDTRSFVRLAVASIYATFSCVVGTQVIPHRKSASGVWFH